MSHHILFLFSYDVLVKFINSMFEFIIFSDMREFVPVFFSSEIIKLYNLMTELILKRDHEEFNFKR